MDQTKKEIRRAILTCVPYFIIVFFLDDLNRFLYTIHSRFGSPLIALYLFLAIIIILSLLIHECIDFRENYKASGYKGLLPLIIYIVTILNSTWSPVRISSDIFHSRVAHQAFRKGHYGFDKMKMLQDGSLDIYYPGLLGMSDWEYGHWSMHADTFYIQYDAASDTTTTKPDTLVEAKDGLLIPAGIPADTLSLYRDRFFRMLVSRKRKEKK